MRKFILLTILILIIIIAFVTLKSKREPAGPYILKNIKILKVTDYDLQVEKAIKEQKLKKDFLKRKINYFFDNTSFTGILRKNGEFFQSLFSVNSMGFEYEIKDNNLKKLAFSIFNPEGSKLKYSIYLQRKMQKLMFSKYYKKKIIESFLIDLPDNIKPGDRIVFHTEGKGIGAWINPLFKKNEKIHPKIVILILLDTLRWDHTSAYGYKRDTTPAIDNLATNSAVYRNCYSTTSWTLPAHVSLFSGKSLSQHKVIAPGIKIPYEYPLLSEFLQNKNYITAAYTGGGFISGELGFARGFTEYSNNPGNILTDRSPEMVLKRFKDFMDRYKGNNMFIFLHSYQIHTPYNKIPMEYIYKFNKKVDIKVTGLSSYVKNKFINYFQPLSENQRQNLIDLYDAGIFYTDKYMVGEVVKYLKKEDLYNNSMIIVTSDHGEEFYDHKGWEHGHSLYNELVKIPLIIKDLNQFDSREEKKLHSISDIPSILLKGLGFKNNNHFKTEIANPERLLKLNIPLSPTIKKIPPSTALISGGHKLIFTDLRSKNIGYFKPRPEGLKKYRIFDLKDLFEERDIYTNKLFFKTKFSRILKRELQLIEKLLKNAGNINSKLKKRLKTLGYLGD